MAYYAAAVVIPDWNSSYTLGTDSGWSPYDTIVIWIGWDPWTTRGSFWTLGNLGSSTPWSESDSKSPVVPDFLKQP